MLQYSAIFHCYNTQSFLTTTAHEATQSFCKITELSCGRAWVGGDAWATRGSVTGSHVTEPRWLGRSVRWLGLGDGSLVHHPT
jgi:hypothetical protein